MATTNFALGGAAANTTVAAGMTYGSLSNALAENDSTATTGAVTTKNAEAFIEVSNFGFDSLIPASALISSVNFRHRGTATTGASVHEAFLRVSGTNGAASSNNNTSLTTVTVTGATRPGGGNWTRADLLNGTLVARLRSVQPNNTTSRTYQWAWVEIEVIYFVPPAPGLRTQLNQAVKRASFY